MKTVKRLLTILVLVSMCAAVTCCTGLAATTDEHARYMCTGELTCYDVLWGLLGTQCSLANGGRCVAVPPSAAVGDDCAALHLEDLRVSDDPGGWRGTVLSIWNYVVWVTTAVAVAGCRLAGVAGEWLTWGSAKVASLLQNHPIVGGLLGLRLGYLVLFG